VRLYRVPDYWGMFRRFRVYVDGKRVASVRRGQSIDLPLQPGRRYEVQVREDWLRSTAHAVTADPARALVCGHRDDGSRAMLRVFRTRELLYLDEVDLDAIPSAAAPDPWWHDWRVLMSIGLGVAAAVVGIAGGNALVVLGLLVAGGAAIPRARRR
jgi:hypothetical protein